MIPVYKNPFFVTIIMLAFIIAAFSLPPQIDSIIKGTRDWDSWRDWATLITNPVCFIVGLRHIFYFIFRK